MMNDNERKELLSKSKPILFKTEMVRAILDSRKTVTRRIMKKPPPDVPTAKFRTLRDGKAIFEWDCSTNLCERKTPYYPNDILYVRETWSPVSVKPKRYLYKTHCPEADNLPVKWHPSIHMPKEAARIFLRVTNVRVERLQDCGNMQAKDEGCSCCSQFARIWDSTIKKSDLSLYGWAANPWVWVIEFERID